MSSGPLSSVWSGIATQDLFGFSVSLVGSYAWVRFFGLLEDRDIVNQATFAKHGLSLNFFQKLCRKLIHITTAPFFVMSWFLYSSAPNAQLLATLVPLLNLFRIGLTGIGVFQDESFVKSMSRSGSNAELLAGPIFYTVTLLVVTAFFWRTSLITCTTIGILAGGDGMADVVGRRFGRHKLPYSKTKSLEGSIAMFIFGSLMAIGLTAVSQVTGFLEAGGNQVAKIFLVSFVCTIVESLPITDNVDDNLAVPFTAICTTGLLRNMT